MWFIVNMQIKNVQHNSFKAGLTKQLLKKEAHINPKQVENYFLTSPYRSRYNFNNLDLKNNKAYAFAFRLCAEIFKNFSKKHNYSGCQWKKPVVFPSDIIVYNEDELSDDYSTEEKIKQMHSFNTLGSIIYDINQNPIKNLKRPMSLGTIHVPNIYSSLEQLNTEGDYAKQIHLTSSDHFLHLFVHENIHSFVYYYLYDKAGCCSTCNFEPTRDHIREQRLDDHECAIVGDILGNYAATPDVNQYNEVVSEAWTKFICDSLDKDCVSFKKDPIEVMRKTPKEFQKILEKVSTIHYYTSNYFTGEVKRSIHLSDCFHPTIKKK